MHKESIEFIVFDIGGTYSRSGIYNNTHDLKISNKQETSNFLNTSELTSFDLKLALVDYLVTTARQYIKETVTRLVAISLGAALDGNSGFVYSSGPLWGKDKSHFDLYKLLNQRAPEFTWFIVNDVTAALFHYIQSIKSLNVRKTLLVTVSTGIACRLFNMVNKTIPLDDFGLQGEIGHIPTTLSFEGSELELCCDCGEFNHVSSFASGRGLIRLSELLAKLKPVLWQNSKLALLQKSGLSYTQALYQSLVEKDDFAEVLLNLGTKNIADILRIALAIDPEIDHIVLTGGVVENLSSFYRAALMKHLSKDGLYISSALDNDFFERRIFIANSSQANNQIGAALYASARLKT